jgi:hypothetical protein
MESRLLVDIRESQERCDCLSPKECRERLSEQLSSPNNPIIVDRYWRSQFLVRHAQIAVRRCDSREVARAAMHREHVASYIDALIRMLTQEFHPDLILNMDESAWTSRPLKGEQKNVFCCDTPIQPQFLENQDVNHVTLVGVVILTGNGLIPFFLSTRVHLPTEKSRARISLVSLPISSLRKVT